MVKLIGEIFGREVSIPAMKRKPKVNVNGDFSKRLATFRTSRAITQKELAEKIGTSQRMIAYYEGPSNYIPLVLLPHIAKTLRISVDELLGLKQPKDEFVPQNARLWRKLRAIDGLAPKDQKAVVHYIEALLAKQSSR